MGHCVKRREPRNRANPGGCLGCASARTDLESHSCPERMACNEAAGGHTQYWSLILIDLSVKLNLHIQFDFLIWLSSHILCSSWFQTAVCHSGISLITTQWMFSADARKKSNRELVCSDLYGLWHRFFCISLAKLALWDNGGWLDGPYCIYSSNAKMSWLMRQELFTSRIYFDVMSQPLN